MESGPRGPFYWLRGWLWCDGDRRTFSMKYPSMALWLSISLYLYPPKWLSITSVSMPSTRIYGKHSTKSVFFPDTHPTKRCHPLLIKSPKIFERPQQLPQNKATERYINEHSLIRQRNYLPNMPPVRRGAANFSHKGNKDSAFPRSATWYRVRIICRDDSISKIGGMRGRTV